MELSEIFICNVVIACDYGVVAGRCRRSAIGQRWLLRGNSWYDGQPDRRMRRRWREESRLWRRLNRRRLANGRAVDHDAIDDDEGAWYALVGLGGADLLHRYAGDFETLYEDLRAISVISPLITSFFMCINVFNIMMI